MKIIYVKPMPVNIIKEDLIEVRDWFQTLSYELDNWIQNNTNMLDLVAFALANEITRYFRLDSSRRGKKTVYKYLMSKITDGHCVHSEWYDYLLLEVVSRDDFPYIFFRFFPIRKEKEIQNWLEEE